ncbi:MAG: class I SAM-dependent methyltransferase [Victivallales bacterium]|nr:class I SAM-dependent methyltransferase [Victivallales bacterium]
MHPWQYDEQVQVGTDYEDTREAESYDRRMACVRDVPAEADRVAKALALTGEDAVWEIGVGTGECALALALRCRHVWGADISPAMLALAKRKATERDVKNVEFVSGGFLSGFRPPEPVSAIVSQLAFHHLPDFWKYRALQGLVTHLRPGGRLFLRDVVFPGDVADYDGFFEQFVGELARKGGEKMAVATARHIRAEFSTLDWVLEGMLTRCGFTILDKSTDGFLTSYLCER